jgi:Transposase DDE domain
MRELAARFGRRIIHVFDRGFVGELWVRVCVVVSQVRAIIRWTGKVHLLDEQGRCRAAWKAVIGKRQGQQQRVFWDAGGKRLMRLRVAWAQVWHPSHLDHPLTLVVVRGYREPWYLLTTETITTEEEAWQIALAYLQRWHIEQVWRLDKSEFGFESVRVWAWEDRLKLLGMAMLAHAFLLHLMDSGQLPTLVRQWLLQHGAPRSGWHCRLTLLPLSRLRAALCWLWQQHLPAWAIPRLRPRWLVSASVQAAGGVQISMLA